jgi:hypothetical protein
VALFLLPAVAVLLGTPSFAAKPVKAKAKAASKAAPKASTKDTSASSSSGSSSSGSPSEGYKYETPGPAGPPVVDTPPSPTPESKPSSDGDKVAAPAAAAENVPAKTEAPVVDKPAASDTPAPAPEVAEEPAAPVEPPPLYVEHLGPSSYPGKLRGIYGGSLWLEPSFAGLQWPYMPKSGVGLSGSVWVDSGYEKINRGPNSPDTSRYLQQGRMLVRVTPTYSDGSYFVQGQAELVANQCQTQGSACLNAGTVDTDDLWIRVGKWNSWDLKAGRFEGWEVYHTGMGLDINTLERRGAQQEGVAGTTLPVPDYYGATYLQYRPSGLGLGYLAFHAYPTDILRFEILGALGTDNATSDGKNYLGTRPVVIVDWGRLKFKGSYEWVRNTDGTQQLVPDPSNSGKLIKQDDKYKQTKQGFGLAAQLIVNQRFELGANLGRGKQVTTDINGNADDTASFTTTSVGGFANLRLLGGMILGLGANWTTQEDNHSVGGNLPDYSAHLQAFAALQYIVWKQLFVKVVLAYARADFSPSGGSVDSVFSNEMFSGRVRLMYLY